MPKNKKYQWRTFLPPSLSLFFFCSIALAAPLKTLSTLPLMGEDIRMAQDVLNNEEELVEFAYFIKELEVYPDHGNPKNIEDIENHNSIKTFFMPPFFQPSEHRGIVGGQEIADEGIKIIAEIYELISAFDYELFEIQERWREKNKRTAVLKKLRTNLDKQKDPLARGTIEKLIEQIQKEIAQYQADITELEEKAASGIDEASMAIRKQVINQVQLKLSFLGISADEDEKKLLQSENASQMRDGMASIIARATGQGQFGYRTAIFESGYTGQQKKWIALYKTIRPDVKVVPLSTNAVYVRSTALSSKSDGSESNGFFLGKSQVINAPRLFLAVNGGSDGTCGNTKSCNVTIEYTWLGATMAKSSRSGAIVMPVYFEADVKFRQPDFEGSVSCDFRNGFKVQGRSDVKDGGIIYDGDVYNQINYAGIEDGSCSYKLEKGDADSAAYHTIKAIYENYMNLKMERAKKSRSEMERYRSYVNQELEYHSAKSQNTNYDFWSLDTWTNALGATWGTVASFVVSSARNFYWHTRIEDSTTMENVKFTTTIKELNIDKNERVVFDGFTVLCWKKYENEPVLAACPSNRASYYRSQADTDLGKNQQLCGGDSISAECLDTAKEKDKNSNVDGNGVIEDPWS